MEYSTLIAIATFATLMSITPGPNNLMLLASGMRFGFVRTLPHMVGIASGMGLLLACCLLGFGQLFTWFPQLHIVLKVLGSLYLVWFTWKITQASTASNSGTVRAKPLGYIEAALFQFINPKAWIMATVAIANFTSQGQHYWLSGIILILCFIPVNLMSVSVWASFGQLIDRAFNEQHYRQIINGFIALLVAYSIYLLWI